MVGGVAASHHAGALGRGVLRLSPSWAAFGEGWAGMTKDVTGWRRDWSVMAGVEGRW